MNTDLIGYYHDRAKEYDKVYLNPAEQTDLQTATQLFQTLFYQKMVLEIACGTAYWTDRIAKTAAAVDAIDANKQMIEIAKGKIGADNVVFHVADMYAFVPEKKYSGLFGGFIWSHIPLQDLEQFIDTLQNWLMPDSILVFIDSNYVENTYHDKKNIAQTDEYGNTYQMRMLESGESYLVLKNFPTHDFLLQKLSRIATEIECIDLTHYWILSAKTKAARDK